MTCLIAQLLHCFKQKDVVENHMDEQKDEIHQIRYKTMLAIRSGYHWR